MEIATILAGIGTIHKIVPVVEAIGSQLKPLVEKEVMDGKQLWKDVEIAVEDLKTAIGRIEDATKPPTP